MIGALDTLFFFAVTPVFANRAAGLLGSTRANFWRLALAAMLLAAWTYGCSAGVRPASFGWFVGGGMVGFGLGGLTMFHALPRLGSNLSNLIVQCGSAIAAAATEWMWLGTALSAPQLAFAATTVAGIALGLCPASNAQIATVRVAPRRGAAAAGVALAIVSAAAQGIGAVISRKAFSVAARVHQPVDAGTAAYERVLGGLIVAVVALAFVMAKRPATQTGATASAADGTPAPMKARLPLPMRAAAPWIVANALTGPVLGVVCFQWALRTTPAGIVQPIVAAAPLLTIPFAAYFEGSHPRRLYYVGACLAAAGVTGLALAH